MNDLQHIECNNAIAELLPWYVNDTLDESERVLVREHLDSCPDCRDNIKLLSQVRHAVRTESPAPLVPAPRTEELLAALDGHNHKHALRSRWQWLAVASIVIVIGAASLLVGSRDDGRDGGIGSPQQFETATSPAALDSINYVVELHFVEDVDATARQALFDAIDAGETESPVSDNTYRVTLALGSLSLTELEGYIRDIESRPEIATAEVVAVQLPVE